MRNLWVSAGIVSVFFIFATTGCSKEAGQTRIVPAERLHTASPYFPFEAQENKESGNLQLMVDVDEDGRPHNCRIVKSDNHHFDESALDFCRRSQFRPALRDHEAVAQKNVPFPVSYTQDPG